MIISVHTPKTGGSSFEQLLKTHFKSYFWEDYDDNPLFSRSFDEHTQNAVDFANQRGFSFYSNRGIQCIHGHLLPYKYKSYLEEDDSLFITWFREPVERLASHYNYWHRKEKITTPLQKTFIEENWSFERFCFSDELKNVYSKYLWNFPIENFDFIGITEYFDEDLHYFASKFLGINGISTPIVNVNPNKKGKYSDNIEFLEDLKLFHAEDYLLYDYALEKRKERDT